jgi:hypothetical protein
LHPRSGQASERAKDHLLMVLDDLLEAGLGGHVAAWER